MMRGTYAKYVKACCPVTLLLVVVSGGSRDAGGRCHEHSGVGCWSVDSNHP